MAKFAYNNAKNASIGYMLFELNYNYHSCIFFKKDIDSRLWSKIANKLLAKLQELIIIYWQNLHHTQKFQNQAYNKGVKPKSHVFGDKVWLNSKYIKTKQNQKLKTKFFKLFQILHFVDNQTYKLKLPKQ